jgi:hypothetical protein
MKDLKKATAVKFNLTCPKKCNYLDAEYKGTSEFLPSPPLPRTELKFLNNLWGLGTE